MAKYLLLGIGASYLLPKTKDMPTAMATHEARKAITSGWTEMPTVTSQEADSNTVWHNASANWNTYSTTVNTTSVSTLLSYLLQSTHSPSTETNVSSDIIAETKKEVTTFPAESFFSTSVYQATVEDPKATTSAITSNLTAQVSTNVPLISSKLLLSVSSNQLPGDSHLKNSDAILTISFAILLALTILGFTVYIINKYRKRRDQYSHHLLHDTSEIADRYTIPDDVLVISGGLYDAPRIYNPNMVYEDDELQNDFLPFSAQPGQLRLEFLPGEKEQDLFSTYETFQIPPGDL